MFLWQKVSVGIFSGRRFFWGNFQAPAQAKIYLFCINILYCKLSLIFYLVIKLYAVRCDDIYDRRDACDTLHVLRSEKQTCGHTILKNIGKETSLYKSEGNFSHIRKFLTTCVILA